MSMVHKNLYHIDINICERDSDMEARVSTCKQENNCNLQ